MIKANKEKVLSVIRQDYETAESWVLFYNSYKKEYFEWSRYIRETVPVAGISTSGSGRGWNDWKIVKLSDIEKYNKWLCSVELMESTLSPKLMVFLDARRRAALKNKTLQHQGKKKINWIFFVQRHYADAMAIKYNQQPRNFWLSENTILAKWKGMVDLARLLAWRNGCEF